MKAAVIQCDAGADKEKNIQRALELAGEAVRRKAQLIVLPEVFNYRGPLKTRGDFYRVVEPVPGPSTRPFIRLAKEKKVAILAGSVYERTALPTKAFNTSILISPSGRIVARYRKIHLFNARLGEKSLREARVFLPGRRPAHRRVLGWGVGMTVCFDLRFPALFDYYRRHKVDILTVPSCFTRQTGRAHWEILLRGRAIEQQAYILAANQTGKDSRGVACFGNSMIVDPWGKVLSRAGAKGDAIIYAGLDKEIIRQARAMLPTARIKKSFL